MFSAKVMSVIKGTLKDNKAVLRSRNWKGGQTIQLPEQKGEKDKQ